jgi:hypothetical protein
MEVFRVDREAWLIRFRAKVSATTKFTFEQFPPRGIVCLNYLPGGIGPQHFRSHFHAPDAAHAAFGDRAKRRFARALAQFAGSFLRYFGCVCAWRADGNIVFHEYGGRSARFIVRAANWGHGLHPLQIGLSFWIKRWAALTSTGTKTGPKAGLTYWTLLASWI